MDKLPTGMAERLGYLQTVKPIKNERLEEFEVCLVKLLVTKNNRFIRIHYKTDLVADVVPYGSLSHWPKTGPRATPVGNAASRFERVLPRGTIKIDFHKPGSSIAAIAIAPNVL